MLTLTLLRHAKAVSHGHHDDFNRDLTDAGRADAARLGAYLAHRRLLPDAAVVSAAVRTTQTFEILAAQMFGAQIFGAQAGHPVPVQFEEGLYNATATQIRDVLRVVDPAVTHLMIVGHNPGIMEAAILLARDGDILDIERMRHRFPPGALAVLTFDRTDWLDARASGGRLDLLLLPEDLVAPE